jgi:hypothetical protein
MTDTDVADIKHIVNVVVSNGAVLAAGMVTD